MTLPLRKRPKEKLGVRQVETKESPRHRKFVRSFVCLVQQQIGAHPDTGACDSTQIECAHVRRGLPQGEQAGIGEKPHDCFTVPLCRTHHAQQHRIGEESFEKLYRVKMIDTALKLAKVSPCPIVKAKAQEVDKCSSMN